MRGKKPKTAGMIRRIIASMLALTLLVSNLSAGVWALETEGVANLSLGKEGTASSAGRSDYPVANATDGVNGTYWVPSSNVTSQGWIQVDLGASALIDNVDVRAWGNFSYMIQGSEDGVNYYTLAIEETAVTDQDDYGYLRTVSFSSDDMAYARYVKVYVDNPTSSTGWTALEFDVWGSFTTDSLECISVSGDSTVGVAESAQLTAAAVPTTVNPRVVWTSSDENVATVDENGLVTGIRPGNVTITATSVLDPTKTVTHNVTVTESDAGIQVETVVLDYEFATMYVADNAPLTLAAIVTPEDAKDKSLTWTSSDNAVATVDNGVVTAVAAGTAIIRAASVSNATVYAECEITVLEDRTTVVNLSLNKVPTSENGAYKNQPLSYATDGVDATYWVPSSPNAGGTLVVDLEETAFIDHINLQGMQNFTYKIEVSLDGETYTTVAADDTGVNDLKEGSSSIYFRQVSFTDVYARYIRITHDRVNSSGWRMFEFDAFGYSATEVPNPEPEPEPDVPPVQDENTIKFDFGGTENVAYGYIGVAADRPYYTDGESVLNTDEALNFAYGFLGIGTNGYKASNRTDGYHMVSGMEITLYDGGTGTSASSDYVYASQTMYNVALTEKNEAFNMGDGTIPIRFAVEVEPNSYYTVKATFANSSATEKAVISLYSEKRHQIVTNVELDPGETKVVTFNAAVMDVYYAKSEPVTTYEDTQLNIVVAGKNAALAALEITKIEHRPTIFICSDSTGCDQYGYMPSYPLHNYTGVGQGLTAYFQNIMVSNQGEGGLSTADNAHLNSAKNQLKAGDYLYVQYGHNENSLASYASNLAKYYEAAHTAGAYLIVVGPIDRSQSRLYDSSTNSWTSSLDGYSQVGENYVTCLIYAGPDAAKDYAAALETSAEEAEAYMTKILGAGITANGITDAAFVDLNADWVDFLEDVTAGNNAIGTNKESHSNFYYTFSNYYDATDRTHINDYGANQAGYIFAKQVVARYEAGIKAGEGTGDYIQAQVLKGLYDDHTANRANVTADTVSDETISAGTAPNSHYPQEFVAEEVYPYPAIISDVVMENGAFSSVTVNVVSGLSSYAKVALRAYDGEGTLVGTIWTSDWVDNTAVTPGSSATLTFDRADFELPATGQYEAFVYPVDSDTHEYDGSAEAISEAYTFKVVNGASLQNLSLGIEGTPSDSAVRSGYEVTNATDGVNGTYWVPQNNVSNQGWILVDLGKSALIDSIDIRSWGGFIYEVQASEDGVTFYSLAKEDVEITDQDDSGYLRTVVFTAEDQAYARYVKVFCDDPSGNGWTALEFDVWGTYATEIVDRISITGEVEVDIASTTQLTAVVSPITVNSRVIWTSADSAIATVDENGLVTGVNAGTVTINATSVKDSTKVATHTIQVKKPASGMPVTGLTLDRTSAVMYVTDNQVMTLTATVSPEDAEDKSLTWVSSDTNVATVENGVVTAVGAGTATITAVSVSNPAVSAECVIVVRNDRTEVLNLSLNKVPTSPDGQYNNTYALTNATDGVDGTFWVTGKNKGSAASSIEVDLGDLALIDHVVLQGWEYFIYEIQVSEDGLTYTTVAKEVEGVTTLIEGTTTAQAQAFFDSGNPVYARYVKILVDRVEPKASSWRTLEFDVYGYYVCEPDTVTLKDCTVIQGLNAEAEAIFTPINADRRLNWSSDDPAVAYVDASTGIVTGVSVGITTLRAVTANGVEASCQVTVEKRKADSLALDQETLYLTLANPASVTLNASYEPVYANVQLVWSSSNESVATVFDGLVTPVGTGNATITVKDSVSGKTATCTVTVSLEAIYVSEISFEKQQVELALGINETVRMLPVLTPSYATETEVTWTSSNDSVVNVSNSGFVTAISPGTATITATVASGMDSTISASYKVTVIQPVQGIEFSVEELYLAAGGEMQDIPVVITPADATNQTIIWTIGDKSIVSIEDNKITPLRQGNTTITATTEDGNYSATLTVLVVRPSESVVLSHDTMTLAAGGATGKLTATVLPETASSKKVIWSSADTSIATVANGIVTPLKTGTVTITVITADGLNSANCVVTVVSEKTAVTTLTLDQTEITMIPGGDTAVLTLTIAPSNATDKNVIWTSSDQKVARVQDGIVTSVGVGTAVVTATVDGQITSAQINVIASDNLITNDSFYLDTEGNPIYSQGGDTYYWYGVKYEQAVGYAENPVISQASRSNSTTFSTVTCYSSKDLINWKFENDIVTTKTEGLGFVSWFGRMGVMYNEKNNNYVLVSQGYIYADDTREDCWTDALVFLTCDTPTGDFGNVTFQKNGEGGLSSISNGSTGDQTVFIDDDGTPYLIASNSGGRSNIYVCEFNEDYTWVDKATRVYRGDGREGNCMFKYNDRYYICNSDLHGWNSSPAYVLMSDSDDILGTYTMLDEPMENSKESYSHVSQTGFFVTVHGSEQDTVLFCGDRWSGFAGNGMGFHSWVPLSFDENGIPTFNDLSQFYFDAKTGLWEVGPNNNYVTNPAFEADRISVGDPMGWDVSGNGNSNVEKSSPYSGRWSWHQTSAKEYTATISQQIKNLPDGEYTLKAWVKSSGGQKVANLYIKGYGGEEINISLTDLISEWTQVVVCENLTISGGICEIGLVSDALANQWIMLDDVTLIRKADGNDQPSEQEPEHTHTYQAVATAPTCTERGYTTYSCTGCDDSYVINYVDALGHTPGNEVVEKEVPATCAADGSYDLVVYCDVCKSYEISRTNVKVPATGAHQYTTESERIEATCTEAGKVIKACDCGATETSIIPAKGHTFSEPVRENEVAATCDKVGSYDEVVYCSVCGEEVSRVQKVTSKLDKHTDINNDGTCDLCGARLSVKPSIIDWLKKFFGSWWDNEEKCNHEYTFIMIQPDCENRGYTVHTCEKCGESYKDSHVPALGHDWDNGKVTKEASCTESGEKIYTCGRCGETDTEIIDKLNHNYSDGVCTECCKEENSVPSKPSWGSIWEIFFGWWA